MSKKSPRWAPDQQNMKKQKVREPLDVPLKRKIARNIM